MPEIVDHQVAALAHRQHGNITRQQLLMLGLGATPIANRVRNGHLYRVHVGVYAVGRPPKTPLERASAAVLACGPKAALSHQSAFALWGFAKQWELPLHVCAPTNRARAGIRTHKFSSLARRDVSTQLGIRVTSPARTVLDHATELTRQQLRRTLADGRRAGHLKPAVLKDILDRNRTHPGRAPLLQAIAGYQPTRSDWEATFPAFCKHNHLPIPLINTTINGHEVDAYYPEHNLIIELDSWNYHQDRHNFEHDRDRDAHQLAHGTPTVRITWERMTETPRQEAARLRKILAARGSMP